MRLLRAFIDGAPGLSNSALVARTSLPKATVSRLTHTLVDAGFLTFDAIEETYRPAPACLSLGRAFEFAHSEVHPAQVLLKKFAKENSVNVGLSAPDRMHMVYLSMYREMLGPHTRKINAGGRLAMATSSPGIAYLASLPEGHCAQLFKMLAEAYGAEWATLRPALESAIAKTHCNGFSHAVSPFGTVGVAASVFGPNRERYAINASYSRATGLPQGLSDHALGSKLSKLVMDVQGCWPQRDA